MTTVKKIKNYLIDPIYAKNKWTQEEYNWLMRTLYSLSWQELYELYKIVYPEGWAYQEKSGLIKKLNESIRTVNFIGFFNLCF